MSEPYRADLESGLESPPFEDSSAAKVLADYAAMPEGKSPSPQPSPVEGEGVKKGTSPFTGEVGRSPGEGRPREIGGRDGPEPTRFGDWEKAGRCIDF